MKFDTIWVGSTKYFWENVFPIFPIFFLPKSRKTWRKFRINCEKIVKLFPKNTNVTSHSMEIDISCIENRCTCRKLMLIKFVFGNDNTVFVLLPHWKIAVLLNIKHWLNTYSKIFWTGRSRLLCTVR